jgi:hypothetical protein
MFIIVPCKITFLLWKVIAQMDMDQLRGLRDIHLLVHELAGVVAEETRKGPTTFGECLRAWIKRYPVIDGVGGDPTTYLLVVLLALAKFHEDPAFFGESAAEAITEVFRLGSESGGILPEALDPYQWKEWVFRRQCGLPLEF